MATSITLSQQVSSDTKKTRSITNINPDASNQQLVNLATALNALTTNTLKDINRIDKTEIDPDITYYSVKFTVDTPDEHITFDDSTNTVTINAAGMQQDTEASIGLRMNIVNDGATIAITNKPRVIDWAFGTNDAIAFYQMSGGRVLGISYIKSTDAVSDQFTMTLAGGTFESNDTTYTYSPVTITFIISV